MIFFILFAPFLIIIGLLLANPQFYPSYCTLCYRNDCPAANDYSVECIFMFENQIIEDLYKIYGNPKCGRHRAVFFDGDEVIKIPYEESGIFANEIELETDPDLYSDVKFAKVRKDEELSSKYGILIIRMERVKPLTYFDQTLPEWTLSIDCQQCGYNKNSELVAYDWENE